MKKKNKARLGFIFGAEDISLPFFPFHWQILFLIAIPPHTQTLPSQFRPPLRLRADRARRELLQTRPDGEPATQAERHLHPTVSRRRLAKEEGGLESGGREDVWR